MFQCNFPTYFPLSPFINVTEVAQLAYETLRPSFLHTGRMHTKKTSRIYACGVKNIEIYHLKTKLQTLDLWCSFGLDFRAQCV